MILVTVGTQLPFDRLIQIVDEVAPRLNNDVIAQTGRSDYRAKNIECRAFINAPEFEALMRRAKLIISHAGIGSVLAARRHNKPIILFPRRADLGEHRNDHQMATAKQLENYAGVHLAYSEDELKHILNMDLSVREDVGARSCSQAHLVAYLQGIITSSNRHRRGPQLRVEI